MPIESKFIVNVKINIGCDSMYLRRLKDLREDRELRQFEIAHILKITRQQYSLYELGKRTLPIDLLDQLADFYETSSDYILGRTNHKTPYPKMQNLRNKKEKLDPSSKKMFVISKS